MTGDKKPVVMASDMGVSVATLDGDKKLPASQLPDNIPAGNVHFEDGETFQAKFDHGELTGPPGKDGDTGKTGPTGPQGEPGPKSDSIDLTLTVADWQEKRQTVKNAMLTMDGYNYISGAAAADEANITAYANANIRGLDMTEEGQITFICDTTPTQNVTVRLYRIAANEQGA